MKRVLALLGVIILLAAVFRLYRLGQTPISLEWDEVALGYDAYSILKTGRDQFGQFLPNNFRSLDDWKPPLYVYSAVPAVAIFGLTEFATRLPSAIFGILAVILTFFLVRELLIEQSQREKNVLALLSSVFLAISPWHLQFSRAAFETNLSVTVTIAAVLAFMIGIRKKNHIFLISGVLFGLALFSYHSTRVATPVILLSLLIFNRRQLPGRKLLLLFFSIYLIFWFFFLPIATNPDAQIRFIVTNDLEVAENRTKSAYEILKDEVKGNDIAFSGKIIHNRRLAVFTNKNVVKIAKNYFSHFTPKFLAVEGDAPLHHAPDFGMMYFFDYPLLFLGLVVYLVKYRSRWSIVLPIWFLAAPLPASVTWQSPHSVRGEIILPTLQIFTAIGFWQLLKLIKNEWKVLYYLAIILFLPVFIFSVGRYLHQYYLHTDYELSRNWLYGRKEAVEYTEVYKKNYDKVLVSLSVDMPYIFWLYYSKYPPVKYLEEGGTVSGGFADERNHFDKYEFRNFNYTSLTGSGKLLIVGTSKDFPRDAKVVKTINYLDGTNALIIAENK